MRTRHEPKPIQGWGWLGDAAEEAAVQAVPPDGRSKNAHATLSAMKPNKKSAAGRSGVPAKDGMSDHDFRRLAQQRYQSEGKVEIDPNARVSSSEDGTGEKGAWVQAWVFVHKPGRT